MFKNSAIILMLLLVFSACKNESKEKTIDQTQNAVNTDFNKMLNNYYEEDLKLNPLKATFSGDSRYNDSFQNFLSDGLLENKINNWIANSK